MPAGKLLHAALNSINRFGLPLKVVVIFVIYIGAMLQLITMSTNPAIDIMTIKLIDNAIWFVSLGFILTMFTVAVAIFSDRSIINMRTDNNKLNIDREENNNE